MLPNHTNNIKKDNADNLLRELQALQQLLDNSTDEDIPILDEQIETEPPLITDAIHAPATKKTENPFLPQAVLDRLTQERLAAQQSAEEAHRTMQRVNEQKQQRARNVLGDVGKSLTAQQKDQLINQMVEEMLPQIADRLRDKLKVMLNR